jgi:hypothetical protein
MGVGSIVGERLLLVHRYRDVTNLSNAGEMVEEQKKLRLS